MTIIPFGPWLPDRASLETGAAMDALNVVPALSGYKPFRALSTVTDALTARVQGAFSCRNQAGTIFNFAGDATKLYHMESTGLTWDDVSRTSGGAYAAPSEGWWKFASFGNFAIACNGVDATQGFEMGTDTDFSALAGSPPIASFVGTIKEFVVLARVSGAASQLQWSAQGNCEDWAASATTQSDSQTFPTGGYITGFVSGDAYALVFQERSIKRMVYTGPPTAFTFDEITAEMGCTVEGSIASYEDRAFFKSQNGFYMIRGGAEIVPIGDGKIDKWFETNFDSNNAHRVSATVDPTRQLYLVSFPSSSASVGLPDTLLAYHWATGRWSRIAAEIELIYPAALQSSYTIDGLASLSATIDGLVYPVDSLFYAGDGRFLLSGFSSLHKQGAFNGAYLNGYIETGDVQLATGRKSLLRGFRPVVEGNIGASSIVVKSRDHQYEAHTASAPVNVNDYGYCPTRVNARYHRVGVNITSSDTWENAIGIDDLKYTAMGFL